jgi:hypothetical protein
VLPSTVTRLNSPGTWLWATEAVVTDGRLLAAVGRRKRPPGGVVLGPASSGE